MLKSREFIVYALGRFPISGALSRPVCRRISEDLEVSEHLLDGCLPLWRAVIDPHGAVTVVSWPEREPVQFLDVCDPVRTRAKAVARKDVCTDVAIRAGTL